MYVFNKDFLKKKLKEKNMTYQALAEAMSSRGVEISENGIKWWFRAEKNKPEIDKIKAVADILEIPIEDLVEQDIFLTKNNVRRVPIVGATSCGKSEPNSYQGRDSIYVSSDEYNEHLYALIACGDSMEPEIEDGDTLLCDPNVEIINGDLVHYTLYGESAVKVYYYDEKKEILSLIPINQAPFFQTKNILKTDDAYNEIKLAKVVHISKDVTNGRKRRLRGLGKL